MSTPLRTYNFTVDEYHRMAEAGVFHEDDRVELLDGQIVEMTPIGGLHVACVIRLTDLLSPVTGSGAVVSVQNPLVLADRSAPQPDIALLRRRADPSGAWLPSHADCLLVIEVADTSVEHDRDVKIPLYARAGVPEAWLVDLSARRIEAYRNPAGGKYAKVTSASRGETLTPLEVPSATLSVDRILG